MILGELEDMFIDGSQIISVFDTTKEDTVYVGPISDLPAELLWEEIDAFEPLYTFGPPIGYFELVISSNKG